MWRRRRHSPISVVLAPPSLVVCVWTCIADNGESRRISILLYPAHPQFTILQRCHQGEKVRRKSPGEKATDLHSYPFTSFFGNKIVTSTFYALCKFIMGNLSISNALNIKLKIHFQLSSSNLPFERNNRNVIRKYILANCISQFRLNKYKY